jgi:hypothetical protein
VVFSSVMGLDVCSQRAIHLSFELFILEMLDQSSKCSRVPFGTLKYVPMSAGNGPIG